MTTIFEDIFLTKIFRLNISDEKYLTQYFRRIISDNTFMKRICRRNISDAKISTTYLRRKYLIKYFRGKQLSGLTGGDGGPGLACRPAIRKVKQRKEIKKKKKEDKQREKWRAGPGLPSCLGGPWPEVNPDYFSL